MRPSLLSVPPPSAAGVEALRAWWLSQAAISVDHARLAYHLLRSRWISVYGVAGMRLVTAVALLADLARAEQLVEAQEEGAG